MNKYAIIFILIAVIVICIVFWEGKKYIYKEIAELEIQIERLKQENKRLKAKLADRKAFMDAQKKLMHDQKKFLKDRDKAMKLRDINLTLAKIRNIVTGLEIYFVENNKYPDNLKELQPDFMHSVSLVDAWENELIYKPDEIYNAYQLISKGADGEIDTNDDIICKNGEFFKNQ